MMLIEKIATEIQSMSLAKRTGWAVISKGSFSLMTTNVNKIYFGSDFLADLNSKSPGHTIILAVPWKMLPHQWGSLK